MKDRPVIENIVQTFYDSLAPQYDQFYPDWDEAVRAEAAFLDSLFAEHGFDRTARILDCACGVGTQAIGLAALGYRVTASDVDADPYGGERSTRLVVKSCAAPNQTP